MPRSMAWLLLILTLTGPLLTHAEAADDLSRLWAGTSDEGGITIEDGGVGDDPVVAADWPDGPSVADSSHTLCDRLVFWPDHGILIERLVAVDEPVGWPASDRQAWLQVFRD